MSKVNLKKCLKEFQEAVFQDSKIRKKVKIQFDNRASSDKCSSPLIRIRVGRTNERRKEGASKRRSEVRDRLTVWNMLTLNHLSTTQASNKDATRNKCIASSNKCLTSSNKDATMVAWMAVAYFRHTQLQVRTHTHSLGLSVCMKHRKEELHTKVK